MNDVLAVDANAAVDFVRADRADPPPLHHTKRLVLPLPVLGELFAGAYSSRFVAVNVAKVEDLIAVWPVIEPDLETARIYGRLRGHSAVISSARRNDLWIAALCLQHNVPLLTNDGGFDTIPNLAVVHW